MTRTQKKRFSDVLDLSGSFLVPSLEGAECKLFVKPSLGDGNMNGNGTSLKVG